MGNYNKVLFTVKFQKRISIFELNEANTIQKKIKANYSNQYEKGQVFFTYLFYWVLQTSLAIIFNLTNFTPFMIC